MNVKDLKNLLEQYPEDMLIAYAIHSEYALMEPKDISVVKMQPARPDGWIHTYPRDKTSKTIDYLTFPGN
jgi:hypothetical protein